MKELKKNIVQKTLEVICLISPIMSFVGVFVVIFLFFCCQNRTEESDLLLNENEICFNEKLVSITKNGGKYYIGTESSGHIYVYLPEKNSIIDTLNIDCGRIYQVKQTNEANTFYVGTQNMGLKKTRRIGKNLKIENSYVIRGKGNRFSCYDVFIDKDTVYAMTSHGIYFIGGSDTLESILSHPNQNGVSNPLVANNLVKASGSLYAATDLGLVVIKNLKVDTIAVQKRIKNVAYHDSFIYALGDYLYKIDPASRNVVDIVKLKAPTKYYFYVDGIHHFLSENYIIIAHDSVLHKIERHKQVNTRRKLSLEGHNVIADGKEYSLLVTENALWQVGHHYPSVFGNLKKEGGVKLACTDGKSAYFLIGKKVYKLSANNVAKEVLELKENGEIKLMECKFNSGIYYVNSDTCVFYQRFNQDKPELIGKSDKEITAMCLHNSVPEGVILGIRDGLVRMEKKKVPEPISLIMDNGKKDTIPYIRRFAVTEYNYYVPTMNEGIFYGTGKKLHSLERTQSIQFIRDVVCPHPKEAANLFWLTNKYLYLSCDDSIRNTNYGSRLFVFHLDLGKVVCIPGEIKGMRVLRLNEKNSILNDTILFSDIVFRAESCVMLNDTLYLGGQSGVIAISNQDVRKMFNDNKSLKYHYVEFNENEKSKFDLWIVFGVAIVVFIGFLFFKKTKIVCILRKRLKDVQDKLGMLSQEKENLESELYYAQNKAEKLSQINEDYKKQLNVIQSKTDELSQERIQIKKKVQEKIQLIENTKPYLSPELQEEFIDIRKAVENSEGLDKMIQDLSLLERKVLKELKMRLSEIKNSVCKINVFQSDLSKLKNEIEEALNNDDVERCVTCIKNYNKLKKRIEDVSQKLEKYGQAIVILDTDVNKLLFDDIKTDKLSLDEAQDFLKEMNEVISNDIKKEIENCLDKLLGKLNGDDINIIYVKNLIERIKTDKSSLNRNGITRSDIYSKLQNYASVVQECLMHHNLYDIKEKYEKKNEKVDIKPFFDSLSEDHEIIEKLKDINVTKYNSQIMEALVLIMILPNREKKYRQVEICKKYEEFYNGRTINKSQVHKISKFLLNNYGYFTNNTRYLTALLVECKDKLHYVGNVVPKG